MKHRIFVALRISDEFKRAIADWGKTFESHAKAAYSHIRWIKPENLHVTLVPPWYEDEKGIQKVEELLNSTLRKEFILNFRRIAYGPDPKRPRLVWLEGGAPRGLTNLRDNLYGMLGKEQEKRPFLLHLTIGRFREEEFSSFPVKSIDEEFIFEERASTLLLMESHLGKGGAEYGVLHKIGL